LLLWAFLTTFFKKTKIILQCSRLIFFIFIVENMKSIKSYFEYRDYLQDFYIEKKRETPFFSLRYMGSKVGVDTSHLV
ncbi:MAG: hypothetical protein N2053_13415, partial [Chitinispirillaceae bacterium]|nr:hypothetical protein [Chitinispirillaceae bacterium]